MKRSLSACLKLIKAWEKRKKFWLGPMTKNRYNNRNVKRAKGQYKNAMKMFDYTTIADRFRTVNWVATTTKLVWLTGLRAQRGEMKFFRLSVLRGSKYEEWNETVCPSVCLTWMPIMRGEIKWNLSVSLGSKIEGWNETYFVRLSILRGSKFEWWNET